MSEIPYLELLAQVLREGQPSEDRTGTGTLSLFGPQIEFNIRDSFPLVTTKKIHFKSVIYELLWMLRGDTNVKWLQDHGVTIWNEWADEKGELGPVYGKQWRKWTCIKQNWGVLPSDGGTPIERGMRLVEIDQIKDLISELKLNPNSRRHILSAWNMGDLEKMSLPPCHMFSQFYVRDGCLSCKMYQRSADMFLGVPFNIAQYSLLTYMIAHVCHLKPHRLIISFGDAHIYMNHITQVEEQLGRNPFPSPTLKINPEIDSIDDFKYEDITLENYQSHPSIPAPIAV